MDKIRYCKNCGKPLEADAKFCTECGTAVAKAPQPMDKDQTVEVYSQSPSVIDTHKDSIARDSEPLDTHKNKKVEKETKSSSPQREQQVKKKKLIIAAAVAAGILIFLGIVAVVLNMNGTNANESLRQGQEYLDAGEYEQAIAAFEDAIKAEPDSVDARIGMADAYVGLKEYSAAISYLDEVLKIDDTSVDGYGKKAQIYTELGQNYELNKLVREADAKKVNLSGKYGYEIPQSPEIIVSDDAYSTVSMTVSEKTNKIKFTVDGTDPLESSSSYDKPLENLSGDVTIKAMAINEKGLHSDIVSKSLQLKQKQYTYNKDFMSYVGKTYKELVTAFGELHSIGTADGGAFFDTPNSNYVFSFESDEPKDSDRCTSVNTDARYFFNGMTSAGMTLTEAGASLGGKFSEGEEAATCEIDGNTIFIYNYSPQISLNSQIRCKSTSSVRGE